MVSYGMSKQIMMNIERVRSLISRYGGFFINYDSCVADCMILARVNPGYVNDILIGLKQIGFILGEVRVVGVQTYIYLRGFAM